MLFIAAYFSLLSLAKQYAAPWGAGDDGLPGINSGPGWGWKLIGLTPVGEGDEPPDRGMRKGDFCHTTFVCTW